MMATLAWFSICLMMQYMVIFHENVASFPLDLLQHFFGAYYFIDTAIIEAERYGMFEI